MDADRLFVTAGVSNALDLMCTLFTRPGDTIFVEEPSYFLALRIFADHGLRVISIETDEDGLLIESLEEKLQGIPPEIPVCHPHPPESQRAHPVRRAACAFGGIIP